MSELKCMNCNKILKEEYSEHVCINCEILEDVKKQAFVQETKRPFNFKINKILCENLKKKIEEKNEFPSMGSLIRYLIYKYIENPSKFEDLQLYQLKGEDLRLNVWVGTDSFNKLKKLASDQKMTATQIIESLLLIYSGIL